MKKDYVEHAIVIPSVIFSRLIYFVWQSVIKFPKKKLVVVHINRSLFQEGLIKTNCFIRTKKTVHNNNVMLFVLSVRLDVNVPIHVHVTLTEIFNSL